MYSNFQGHNYKSAAYGAVVCEPNEEIPGKVNDEQAASEPPVESL